MNRRDFIKSTIVGSAALALPAVSAREGKSLKPWEYDCLTLLAIMDSSGLSQKEMESRPIEIEMETDQRGLLIGRNGVAVLAERYGVTYHP